jgi:hypothetical protein
VKVDLNYVGRSEIVRGSTGPIARFAANLARTPVAFDAELRDPLRFREAMSALHDVVVSDLRFKKRDRSQYEAWKANEEARLRAVRSGARQAFEAAAKAKGPVPRELEREYESCRARYWKARFAYADILQRDDPALWRILMPCDPVVTVADDVVLFECFSSDESSYGCLSVDRDAFAPSQNVQRGTTNVDFSWPLFDHFQSLRTYRRTRFLVDPAGVGVATSNADAVWEQKIDLPNGWLRGFLQVQAAMGLPTRRVTLTREAVHSVVAWLVRHRERASPRALRFELLPGREPVLVLEPWEQRVAVRGPVYDGPAGEPIRVWGRRRLASLARLLPLADRVDVHLLGTGLPSFWVVRMGALRFTLGLSGWTTNDWTSGSALDAFASAIDPAPELVARTALFLQKSQRATLGEIASGLGVVTADASAALNRLALAGQSIFDLTAGVHRWRQILPIAVGEAEIGPEPAEPAGARKLLAEGAVSIASRGAAPGGGTIVTGTAGQREVEVLLDAEGVLRRAKCGCSHHHRFGIRKGPCRHVLAVRLAVVRGSGAANAPGFIDRLLGPGSNN